MKDPAKPGLPPGGGTKVFFAAFFAICGIGLGIYAFSLRGSAVNHGAMVAVTTVGIVIPVLFLLGTYAMLRIVFPPSVRGVTLTLSNSDIRRGADVDVRVEVSNPDRMITRLEFGLICTEYYDVETTDARGNRSRTTRQVDTHADWRPFTGGPAQTERFHVPDDGPFSYHGNCLSYAWRASARLPNRLRFDRAENVRFVVRP